MAVSDDVRGTVLVADDEAILLRLLTRILERAGFRVVPARDVEEGLHRLSTGSPLDAAVVDATLQPGGATPLLEALARAPGRPGLVVTSGEALSQDAQKNLEACGGRFLAKPFGPTVLLEAIEAVRSRAREGS